jgi:hypothetical protein
MSDEFEPRDRYFCPICPWTLDEPVEDDDPAATEQFVRDATLASPQFAHNAIFQHLVARIAPIEGALREHCESHKLEEWLAAAVKLFMLRQSLKVIEDAPAPSDERMYSAICAGELTVNDGRWVRAAAGIIDALKETKAVADV